MAGQSDIEWTDATWNPVSGCLMISPGCTNCYAMRMASRLQAMEHPSYKGVTRKSGNKQVWTGRIHLNDAALEVPLRWRQPRRVFVNSMSDLFQDGIPDDFIAKVWSVMERAHWHSFQVLTKRPDNMRDVLKAAKLPVLPNVWLGTSVESAAYSDRIKILRSTPAAVRFVSFEPLIGAVGRPSLKGIHWAIVGGESGPSARPMDAEWVTTIQDNCEKSGTAFFFKQWGGVNKKKAGRELNGRTWDEYPRPLLVAAE
jgi:protein gp37